MILAAEHRWMPCLTMICTALYCQEEYYLSSNLGFVLVANVETRPSFVTVGRVSTGARPRGLISAD